MRFLQIFSRSGEQNYQIPSQKVCLYQLFYNANILAK